MGEVEANLIEAGLIEKENTGLLENLQKDYAILAEQLDRQGRDIETIAEKIAGAGVAIPSWGVGTGGTRFARFPMAGEPRDVFDKLADCGVIHQLTQATPSVSLHIPWDKADPQALKATADQFGLGFDAVNSNTFQDHHGQHVTNLVPFPIPMRRHAPKPSPII